MNSLDRARSGTVLILHHYKSQSGETGRRTGLKIQRGRPRVGSIPTSGTSNTIRCNSMNIMGYAFVVSGGFVYLSGLAVIIIRFFRLH